MIIVHGMFPVLRESREKALKLMQEMAAASRLEPGCVSYEFYSALTNSCQFLLFQEWSSVEALQAHFETEHMETFLAELPSILNGEIVTRRYEVRNQDEQEADEEFDESEVPTKKPALIRPKIVH